MEKEEIKKMINRYEIKYQDDGSLVAYKRNLTEEEINLLKSTKAEVVKYFEDEKKATAERHERFESIPGLCEIRKAREELAAWHDEFNYCMDMGCGIIPAKPKTDIEALESQFPDAVFALKIEREMQSMSYDVRSVASKAYNAITEGESIKSVKAQYDADSSARSREIIWN